jgi:uncharacterized membrane protein YkvI
MSEPREHGLFATLLLPAIVAQSMIIGGGYSTGREIMEYAGRFGPRGWWAVVVIFLGFAVLSALAFEVARLGRAYDYKSWGRLLIGRLWPVYDILLVLMLLLVIAVMQAAVGSILEETVGLPYGVGLAIVFVMVGLLAWRGTSFIERFETVGSVALYVAYIVFSVLILTSVKSTAAVPEVASEPSTRAVLLSGVQYVGYNLAVLPPVLFCLHRQRRRSEALVSGLLSGAAMTIPFALTFLCLMRFWPNPGVVDADVPWIPMLTAVGERWGGGTGLWIWIFGVVAGWTLLETAVGGIHALVDRLERNLGDLPPFLRPAGGEMLPWQRSAAALVVLTGASLLARLGIIDLVKQGYGALSWGFILFMALPLLVVGTLRMSAAGSESA